MVFASHKEGQMPKKQRCLRFRGVGRAGHTMSADIMRLKAKSRRNWGLEGSELQKLQKHRRGGAGCR